MWVIGVCYVQVWWILSSYPKWLYQFTVVVPVHTLINTLYYQSWILIILVGVYVVVVLICIFWWFVRLSIFSFVNCTFLYWVVCLLLTDLQRFFMCSEYKFFCLLCILHISSKLWLAFLLSVVSFEEHRFLVLM